MGFTKLEKACIELGVPKTGDPDLDAIIKEANRRKVATMAMQGLLTNGVGYLNAVDWGIQAADALLAELDGQQESKMKATEMFAKARGEEWVENNKERPKIDGVYQTINSDDRETPNFFRDGHWQIYDDKPVVKWLKVNQPEGANNQK